MVSAKKSPAESLLARLLDAVTALGGHLVSHNHLPSRTEDRLFNDLVHFFFRLLILLLAESRGLLRKALVLEALKEALFSTKSRLWKRCLHLSRDLKGSDFFPLGGKLFQEQVLASLHCPDPLLAEVLTPLFLEVDYSVLAPESLGYLHEELLSYIPKIAPKPGVPFLLERTGMERRLSGSFYTHRDLVDALIHSALEPVVEARLKKERSREEALSKIKVVDPACGGAAFLVGAQDYLARRLASRAEVAKHCIHGVDRDPMAVELARLSLWLNSEKGKLQPGDLDAAIQCGDSLVGCPVDLPPDRSSREELDAWTASFFDHLGDGEETERFFHWPIAFPGSFSGPAPGFDCVLTNPPWERIKIQEKEFFRRYAPEIASAGHAAQRRALIARLEKEQPRLFARYQEHLKRSAALRRFFRRSGRYDLALTRDQNSYLFFAVLGMSLLNPEGRAGMVVPSGIATDLGAAPFFRSLVDQGRLVSLYDFVNFKRLFRSIAGPNRFSLLTLRGASRRRKKAVFRFYAESVDDLKQKERLFSLSRKDLALVNPNTRTCPPLAGCKEALLLKRVYQRIPVLVNESKPKEEQNGWRVRLWNMFHMSTHASLFKTREELMRSGYRLGRDQAFRKGKATWLRLYEAKLMHNLDHRYNTFEGVPPERRKGVKPKALSMTGRKAEDPQALAWPRYWISEEEVKARVSCVGWKRKWFLAVRSVTNVTTNRRSAVAAVLPWCAVGNSAALIHMPGSAGEAAILAACLSSFAFDYMARMKLGGPNLNFFILKQLPVPPPEAFRKAPLDRFIRKRALELIYTARDLAPFAREMGYKGPPFPWNEERRRTLRAELDALFFMLYDLSPEEAEAAFETFTILKKQELTSFGAFRTKEATLKALKRMLPYKN